jgi:hypothetical protein
MRENQSEAVTENYYPEKEHGTEDEELCPSLRLWKWERPMTPYMMIATPSTDLSMRPPVNHQVVSLEVWWRFG